LNREKSFFENLFENAPEAIVLCDREERVIKANRAFVELFGFSMEEMEGNDLNLFVAQDPELFREAQNIDALAWSGGEPFSVDTWRTRKDGTKIPVKVLQFPFRIDQSTLVDYTIYRDRSEEMKARSAILREKSLFEGLFENCPDAIILGNRDVKILRVNRAFYEFFGYSPEDDIIGRDIYGIIAKNPSSESDARHLEESFWRGEKIDTDVVRQRKDGSDIHLHLTQVPLQLEDGSTADYIIYRDIGYRKQAEEALKESEKRYAAIVEEQTEMVCRFLPGGEVTFVNDSFCLFFGTCREQVVSRPLSLLLGSANGDLLESGPQRPSRSDPAAFIEHPLTLPSGKQRWLRWSRRGIFSDSGELTEIQAVGRDITEIKQTEEELRHLNSVIMSVRGVNRLINRQHDSKMLVQEICAHLVETRGYRNVWIAILAKGGKLATISEAGLRSDGRLYSERIRHGILNDWALAVLKSTGVSLKRGVSAVTDCPLLDRYEESGIMSARLEHTGRIFGLISVTVPGEMPIDPEEQTLFSELAEDISFALNAREIEMDRAEKADLVEGKVRQLELVASNRRDGLWEWDVENGRVDFSPGYETMLGYSPGEMNRSIEGWKESVHPEDLPEVLRILDAVVSGTAERSIYEAAYRIRTRNGGWMMILDRGSVVRRDRSGRAVRIVGTHMEISCPGPEKDTPE
jgi:PAS domain S-box-containing protein